eukprot:749480_1
MTTEMHFVNNFDFNHYSISQKELKNGTTSKMTKIHANDRNEIIVHNNENSHNLQQIPRIQSMDHIMTVKSNNKSKITDRDITLQNVIKNGPKLTLPLIKNVIYKLLMALLPFHVQNKVHRDINPSNIICVSNTTQIRLIGFNLEKCINPINYYNDSLKVTPYHAPESFDIRSGNDLKKSDIWAIGCILFELFTGQPLVGGDCEWGYKGNIMMSRFTTFPTDIESKISSIAMDLLNTLLNPNPNERLTCKQALIHKWFCDTPQIQLLNIYKLIPTSNLNPKAAVFAFNNLNNQIISQKKVNETELIINNLPNTINENVLLLLFGPYGSLEQCKIICDLHTYGYGFVKYDNALSAKRA